MTNSLARPMNSGFGYSRTTRVAGTLSLAALLGLIMADIFSHSFWSSHALLTSTLSDLVVVILTVAVINEFLERANNRRWKVLAQVGLLEQVRTARSAWLSIVEIVGVAPNRLDDAAELRNYLCLPQGRTTVTELVNAAMDDPERRERLTRLIAAIADQTRDVLTGWAPVLTASHAYVELIDRLAELHGRVVWTTNLLGPGEEAEQSDSPESATALAPVIKRMRRPVQSGDQAEQWVRRAIVAIVDTAADLDRDTSEVAEELVPRDWWRERTQARVERTVSSL